MAGNAKDLSWNKFMLGLAILALALGIFEYVKYDALVSSYMRTLGAIAFSLANLIGYIFLGSALWGAVRLIRGEGKAPAPKLFVLIATLAVSVVSVIVRM